MFSIAYRDSGPTCRCAFALGVCGSVRVLPVGRGFYLASRSLGVYTDHLGGHLEADPI